METESLSAACSWHLLVQVLERHFGYLTASWSFDWGLMVKSGFSEIELGDKEEWEQNRTGLEGR